MTKYFAEVKTVEELRKRYIDKLIEPYLEQLFDEQLEEVKNLMHKTALIAE